MNAYAQNTSAGDGGGDGYAPLTPSLLARKGEAMPAVDADAHEGVDIDMRPLKPANSPGAPKQISEEAIETLYAESITADDADGATSPSTAPRQAARRPVRLIHSAAPNSVVYDSTAGRQQGATPSTQSSPQAWTLRAPQRQIAVRLPPPSGSAPGTATGADRVRARLRRRAGPLDRKAVVTLRMPARDLVRLRFAARDLEMSCQEIILEAIECYLDANDVPPVTDKVIMRETERLLSKTKKRRRP